MKIVRYALFLILAGMLFSCSKKEADVLQVTSPLPSGTISSDTAIILTFSKGVAPADSTNIWMTTPFIEFTPAVPGKFVWQDTSRLVFSPDAPFQGDTRFKARINAGLLTQLARMKSFSGPEEFSFATQEFTLRVAEFFYDRIGPKRQVGIKANLEFTYAVDPADLSGRIKLTIDGKSEQVQRIVTPDRNRTIAVEVATVEQRERPRSISLDFDNSLISPETNTRIKMERPFVFTLPPLGELEIYGHEFGYDGVSGWIRIRTSQEVDSGAVRQYITLDPVRDYTVDSDNQGFTLRGKFEPGTTFHVVVKKDLESVLGGKLRNDYVTDIVIGNIQPSFRFASASGVYMMLGGQKELEIRTVNLPGLIVRVSQIFQNNLLFFLESGRSYDYYYDEEEGWSEGRKYRYYLGNFGRVLSSDTMAIANSVNREVTTLLDLGRYLNTGYKGFYLIEIANPAERWRSTSKLVSISNLGLIVKRSDDEVMVFVTNLETNEAVPGVQVSLISTNNQVIASMKSDGDGVAHFSGYREVAKDFELKLVTAELENDFNFINLDDYRVENSRFDVGGKKDIQGTYDAMLYGDRNLYRPGETMHVSGIVRSLGHGLPGRLPVKTRVINPKGTAVSEQQFNLNEQGSFEMTYQTQPTSLTGDYRVELYTGTGLYLSGYKVGVEDFVPDRLKVRLTPSRETARPGDKITYDLQALNFFGPPAAGRNYEFEGSFDIIPYRSKNFPDFRFFDDAAKNYSGNPEVIQGKTNEEGKALIDFALPKELTSPALLRARGRVAVFDESGRPVYQIAMTTVYPKPYLIGIRNYGSYYIRPNAAQKVQIVAVDLDDKPIAGFKARVQLVRYEWHSVLRQAKGTNTLRYVSERVEIPVSSGVVTLGGQPADYSYSAPRSGDYSVRISRDGDTGYNQFSFFAYSWGTTDITSFEVNPEARVDIVLDKKMYAPGDRAKVLFQTPFSGKLLVTVERNRVFSYRYLDAVNNAASMDIAVDESFLPNVYVSAVLFRKIRELKIPLLAGHGFVPLMVEKTSNRLDVAISAPEKMRPRRKQDVTVTVGGESNAFVTLAAVDEGILQLRNYRSPDPYAYFYARKALQTETFDFFRDLLPEPEKSSQQSSPGGGEGEMAKRANPLGVRRFKPLALWSGILKTNGSGKATVTLDVPEFSGELRLMAVAYKGDRFGAAEMPMKVADPVILTPAIPRFLSPNDSLAMSVTAFNTTEAPVSLTLGIETSGGIVAIEKSAKLDVGPNQERYVAVPLRATSQIGKAVVRVKTTVLGENLESVTELPVRPTAPFASDAVTGYVEAGKTVEHEVPDVYLPYGRRAYVTLSPYPVANFAKELKYLVGYPHGCIEQTVSKAFPQIYLRDIAVMLDPTVISGGSPTYFVNEAIRKLTDMQLSDGTFSFWPGGGPAGEWSIVYATHFLLEARKAGYAVPEATLNSAVAAVGRIARGKKTQDYYYQDRGRTLIRRIADKSTVYALYVLAVAGSPEKPVMNYYRNERGLLSLDTQVLLAGAFALGGDRLTFNDLLPRKFGTEDAIRTTGYNFDSPVRANALILNVLMDTDLNNPSIPMYMDYLSNAYRGNRWYSTQDDAFTLLAFGKAARMASAAKVEGTVSVGSRQFPYRGGNQRFDIEPYGKKVSISLRGDGRVYYAIVVDGIRTDGRTTIEDRNLQVRREFFNRNGAPVGLGSVRQNDLVIVRLVLNSSVDLLENVAVTDLLPAGFEIENPRLTETTAYPFIKNPTTPEYTDIRDDRINLYTNFRGSKQQAFYYMVRAVSPGAFEYAPVVAEAMYNAEYYSASGQGRLRVTR